MEPAPEHHFRIRVLAPDPTHDKPALFGIQYVGGLASVRSDVNAIRIQRSSPPPKCQLQRPPVCKAPVLKRYRCAAVAHASTEPFGLLS